MHISKAILSRPSGTPTLLGLFVPSDESLGYCRSPLRGMTAPSAPPLRNRRNLRMHPSAIALGALYRNAACACRGRFGGLINRDPTSRFARNGAPGSAGASPSLFGSALPLNQRTGFISPESRRLK